MRQSSLSEELSAISHEYDYGIVPKSAAVFMRDETNGIGRLDLTLLEDVMIVIEVSNQGYKVTSVLPASDDIACKKAAKQVELHVDQLYETMESLLMSLSPMFCERFQQVLFEKLEAVHNQRQEHELSNTTFEPNDFLNSHDSP
ncbi:hypothetical protein J3Q64DRAFT_1748524 [Phycomyces blakesleeanus]|uniref:GSKIP domain-containing protein n=2 Tax=Phycomyces blakesleeanus TaxID=4837 RepID=A0A162XBV7_PHYB8|nr:hypothetical protein PHYBLDRAFT_158796 [Phycomyces blakesleeanus NRRL 1555(-)]OAD73795.1 hypothetical protein PHYBLDRAFT_158796 [Phycomyces blakesleeanus NRRL 1555(-)]|eukprot:XP_018291835.1 hypothetical protein PHYBLDRAFT_158796 [Phycomyces blakesleeanus NRRL 1555(-)]